MKIFSPLAFPILLLLGHSGTLTGQSPVTAFAASYGTAASSVSSYTALPASPGTFSGCSSTTYTYTFSNSSSNQYRLSSFNAAGNTFVVAPAAAATVRLRRVNNAGVTGTRNIVYMETTASSATACPSPATLNFKPPYLDVMEDVLRAGILNQGTDNIFTNASNGDDNNNNIERVDVIFPSRLNTASPGQAGFAIFDRGSNFNHDPFRIVAITSLDAQGNPASFGVVKSCAGGNGSSNNGGWGHPSTANGNKQFAAYVLRKDASEAHLRVSSNVNQEVGGVFFSFADLGITSGQPLYGYALLGPDGAAAPGSTQLLNLNDATVYPTNTTESSGGGLDLVAVNTVFATGSYVVLSLPEIPTPLRPRQDPPAFGTGWQIFPTISEQGQLLQLQGLHDGSYMLSFYSTAGSSRKIPVQVRGGKASVPSPVIPGIYWVQLNAAGQTVPGGTKILVR